MEGDSEMEVSIANPTLTYLSIYDATGERVTSFVTGVHGDTVEELQAKAEAEYPDKTHVVQDAVTYNEALQGDLLYKNGEYVPRPNQQRMRSARQHSHLLMRNIQQKSARSNQKWPRRKQLRMKIIIRI